MAARRRVRPRGEPRCHAASAAVAHGAGARHAGLPARACAFWRKTPSSSTCASAAAGLARDDERRFALRVLEGVLGGTSSSRLFQEVRERRGLAYSVFSYSNLYAHDGRDRPVCGHAPREPRRGAGGREPQSSSAACEDPASEEELVRSRENLKGRVVLGLESTGARMSRLGASRAQRDADPLGR